MFRRDLFWTWCRTIPANHRSRRHSAIQASSPVGATTARSSRRSRIPARRSMRLRRTFCRRTARRAFGSSGTRARSNSKAQQAHAAGIKAYAWFQFIVLPKALVAKFKDDICDERGRIDLERPMTQKILRAQIAEVFARCPSLDGLVVRTGEVYLQDSPFHAASANANESKTQSSTAIIHGPDSHIALLKILRDEACVKLNKLVIYRTWDFGNNFHVNPEYYLKVTDAIEPHPNLIFSIKHQAGDFLRMTPFNPTLGIGSTGRSSRCNASAKLTARARIRIMSATASSTAGKNMRRSCSPASRRVCATSWTTPISPACGHGRAAAAGKDLTSPTNFGARSTPTSSPNTRRIRNEPRRKFSTSSPRSSLA